MNTRTVYSEKLKDALSELRPAFREVGQGLDHLTKKRADIAPAFMKTFALFKRETGRGWLAFVQAIDPSVPADRKGYRAHASYRAAEYIKQQAAGGDKSAGPRGLTPLALLATTLKSVLPMWSQKDQMDALAALLGASKWRDADQRKLLTKIRRARAIGLPKVPRLVDSQKSTKAVVVAFEKERLAS